MIPPGSTQILDKGYVRFVDKMGTDLTIANSARVSFDKQSTELTDKDKKLIKFLANHGHTSPFRHAMIQFEVYAPLMVARQWWKYVVGSDHTLDAWNESSRRYITEEPIFYIPNKAQWRLAPEDKKQGSADNFDTKKGDDYTHILMNYVADGEALYNKMINDGMAPEQARLFLPSYGMYVRWYWTTSLQGALHFLDQRLEHSAQYEIQQYAKAIAIIVQDKFPEAYNAWQEKPK